MPSRSEHDANDLLAARSIQATHARLKAQRSAQRSAKRPATRPTHVSEVLGALACGLVLSTPLLVQVVQQLMA